MNNQSRIPSISFNGLSNPKGKELSRVKRPRLSSPMLQDLTNQIHNVRAARRSSTDTMSTKNTRLMNKYVFGDAAVIEEVKKRERKILKDITHFKNAISEIEKETQRIKDVELPDIQYAISKKITISNEIRKETSQVESQLSQQDYEIDLQKKNEEMFKLNMKTKHSVEVQEFENKLKKTLNEKKGEWNVKLLELENMKPDKDIADEIEQLKKELQQVNDELNKLKQSNNLKCKEYSDKLSEELIRFQESKRQPLIRLMREQEQLIDQKKELETDRKNLVDEIDTLDRESEELTAKISELHKSSLETETRNEPLRDRTFIIDRQYEIAKNKNESVKKIAREKELYYNAKFDKMEQEQLRRRRLENSIDELKGEVRRFAYVINDSQASQKYIIDYSKKSLLRVDTGKKYFFTRVIPSSLMPEDDLLFQEYSTYHEMCLQKRWNFNLMSVNGSSKTFRMCVIKFIHSKCFSNYKILLQYVFLSEEMPSRDMLLRNSGDCDNEIKLKIEQDSLELDSKQVELTDDIEALPSAITNESQEFSSGIAVLKFELRKRDDLQDKPINFYSVEINDEKTIKILDNSITSNQMADSPLGLIFKKLLSVTKSFFLFNIDLERESETSLMVCQKLASIKINTNKVRGKK